MVRCRCGRVWCDQTRDCCPRCGERPNEKLLNDLLNDSAKASEIMRLNFGKWPTDDE